MDPRRLPKTAARANPTSAAAFRRWLRIAVLLLCPALAPAGDVPGVLSIGGDGTQAVTARFLADANGVAPGGSLRVGVLLTLGENWHVYWRNPGDSGLATDLSLSLPKGYRASAIHWPIPVRFTQAGGIAGFGYEDQVLLWRTVSVPKNARPGREVTIPVRVDWLACRVECVPGKAVGSVRVRITSTGDDSKAARSRTLFDSWSRKLPADANEPNAPIALGSVERPDYSAPTGRFRFSLTWADGNAPKTIEWFPPPDRAISWGSPTLRPRDRTVAVSLPMRRLQGQTPSGSILVGLLAWRESDGTRRALRVPLKVRPTEDKPADRPADKRDNLPNPKGPSP